MENTNLINLNKKKLIINKSILFCCLLAIFHFISGFHIVLELIFCFTAIYIVLFTSIQTSFNIFLFLHCFLISNISRESVFNFILYGYFLGVFIKFLIGLFKGKYKINKKILIVSLSIYIPSILISFFHKIHFSFFPYLTYIPLFFIFFSMKNEFNIHEGMKYLMYGLITSCILSIFSLIIPNYGFSPFTEDNRFKAFLNDPNYLYMRALFLLSYYMYRFLNNDLNFLNFILIFIFCSIITFLTISKTGILLLLFLIFIFSIFYLKDDFKKKIKYILILGGLFLLAILILHKQIYIIIKRFINASGTGINFINSLFTGRIDIWKDYLAATFSNIWNALFGHGILAYEVFIKAQGVVRASHNLYIFILYRFGIIGTIALCYLIYLFIKEAKKENFKLISILPLIWFLLESFCDNTFKTFNIFYIILICMILFCNKIENKKTPKSDENNSLSNITSDDDNNKINNIN